MGGGLSYIDIPHPGIYSLTVTFDKWIVLAVAVGAIIALNVNFIRRMNRRGRDPRDHRDLRGRLDVRDDPNGKE
jgi:hypothetical protein